MSTRADLVSGGDVLLEVVAPYAAALGIALLAGAALLRRRRA